MFSTSMTLLENNISKNSLSVVGKLPESDL